MKSALSLLWIVCAVSLGGLLFGFDSGVISGCDQAVQAEFALAPFWHGLVMAGALIGTVFGALAAGKMCDRLGRKPTLVWMGVLFLVSAAGCAVTPGGKTLGPHVLAWMRFIGGIGTGGVSVAVPMYIAEIAPPRNRGKLVLVYQFRNIAPDVLRMLNGILGGINNSLLFLNVREARSLCYYCLSSYSLLKGVLSVDCGVQTADLPAAEEAVREQIALLQSGDFPDSMLREAVLDYIGREAAQENTNAGIADRIADGLMRGDTRSPEETAAALAAVTKAQITEAARQLTPAAVYILRAEEAENA